MEKTAYVNIKTFAFLDAFQYKPRKNVVVRVAEIDIFSLCVVKSNVPAGSTVDVVVFWIVEKLNPLVFLHQSLDAVNSSISASIVNDKQLNVMIAVVED